MNKNISIPNQTSVRSNPLQAAGYKAEVIPVVSADDESFLLHEESVPDELPVLPIRDNVLFPGVAMPINVSRPKSLRLLKEAEKNRSLIAVFAQVDEVEEPQMDDLYTIGVVARVIKLMELPRNEYMAVVQASQKCSLDEYYIRDNYNVGKISMVVEEETPLFPREFKRSVDLLRKKFSELVSKKLEIKDNSFKSGLKNIGSDKVLVNFVASHLEISVLDKQLMLEQCSYAERVSTLISHVNAGLEYYKIQDEINAKTQRMMDRQQREYFLNQQMRVIQDELGGSASPVDRDVEQLVQRAMKKHWSTDVQKAFEKSIEKLQRTPIQTPDYTVELNYLETMLSLPWETYTKDDLRVDRARKQLDKDHFGIEKVKDRIIEYLSVLSLKGDLKSPILCLVGPPGTGKTSLGKSIAAALNRKYVRVALGGLHDESEIRGHRRTYIGAMPGRIIQSLKKAGSGNPVFILDEIDKIQGMSHNGDPTSALLEVLDPEQNNAFHDNYLDLDYDLSKVLFVATANSLSTIQPALLDRMEIIDLSGYILEEKIQIAQRHLVPRQLTDHGFKKKDIKISDAVLTRIINDYTRESGVRQLDKSIAKVVRRRAVDVAAGRDLNKKVAESELKELLGLPIHTSEVRGQQPRVGVVTGLAWTQVGGEILFIESVISKGKGTLSMTGNLGDVMKESATLSFEYLKANAQQFGIDYEKIESSNLHIHVPEGATPKDGPSAGITMFTAMVSAFTQGKVRPTVAMTGEITLRGAVTPVGGIKEKILAAKRAGITDIILSESNRRDIEDINTQYLEGLEFHYITEMHQALPIAFEEWPVASSVK